MSTKSGKGPTVLAVGVIIALAVAAIAFLSFSSLPPRSGSSSISKATGVCLEEVPSSATIGNYYNSTFQGYSVTYPNGTRVFSSLNSCPVPVYHDAFKIDSAIEADPKFIAAENGSGYEATNVCNCSIAASSSNSTGEYAILDFVLYGSQILYPCGANNYWVYNQLGLIIVTIPINSTGGLQYSHAEIQSGPGSNSYPCTTTAATSTTVSGSTSVQPQTWSYQGLTAAVTNSSEVKPHLVDAYYYIVMRYGAASSGNGNQLFEDIYVIGAQAVTGNWTTGYNETLTGQQIFNATVQYTEPSTYNVTSVTVKNLVDQSAQVSFDATQKQAIEVALANSSVKADIGGMNYYVGFADSQVNDSAPGYWVMISQINGYRSLGVLVDPDLTGVSMILTSDSPPNIGWP